MYYSLYDLVNSLDELRYQLDYRVKHCREYTYERVYDRGYSLTERLNDGRDSVYDAVYDNRRKADYELDERYERSSYSYHGNAKRCDSCSKYQQAGSSC